MVGNKVERERERGKEGDGGKRVREKGGQTGNDYLTLSSVLPESLQSKHSLSFPCD